MRQDNGGVFFSLFKEDGRGPVSNIVQSLWTNVANQNGGLFGFVTPAARGGFFPSAALKVGIAPGGEGQGVQAAQALQSNANAFAPAIPIPLARPSRGSPVNLLQFTHIGG